MIVVDTNIISYFFISNNSSRLVEKLFTKAPRWHAPLLWRSEFRNVLSKYLRKDILSLSQCFTVLQQAEQLMSGNEYQVTSPQVFDLVASSNCTAYDCEFVALAQHLNTLLVTEDKKIIREFPKVACSIKSFLD